MSQGAVRLGPGGGRHPSRELAPRAPARATPAPVKTLAEVVLHWGRTRPSQPLLYCCDLEDRLTVLTAGELLQAALRLGAHLHARGVRRGDRVVLSFDTSPEFLQCFFACGLVGATPCLIELPSSKVSVKAWGERLRVKLRLLGARAMLIDPDFMDLAQEALAGFEPEPGCPAPFAATPGELAGEAPPLERPFEPALVDEGEAAFIQFTSGTTDAPKAIQISHRALLANCAAIGESGHWDADDLMVCWLPLFHDMGLVASVLSSFVHGLPTALIPPFGFLLKPSRWLWAMHYFRATSCFAPNFAYQLCVKRIKDGELEGLELGAWKRAYNAAEFIHADTVHQFTERFAPHGFEPDAWRPSYGMAEMVVGVTSRGRADPLSVERISRAALASRRQAVLHTEGAGSDALVVHGVGRPLPGVELKIVDEEGQPLGERLEGEILLRGSSLFSGYYQDPQATQEVLREGWLHTGDLGYLAHGELFICGRSKDLIIKAGENHHPYTMENAAARVAGVRVGCVAAVGVNNPQTGTEDIVIVCETTETKTDALRQLCKHVEETVYQDAGIRPNRVVPVAPHTLPKTTSGKLKRAYIRQHAESFENLSLLVAPPSQQSIVH